MGRVYKRGPFWWIQYSFRGRAYRESSKSMQKSQATALLCARIAEMRQGRLVGPKAESTTLEDLRQLVLQDYEANERKSALRAEENYRQLARFFDKTPAVDIDFARVGKYIELRKKEGRKSGTIARELRMLKRGLKLAVQAGLLHSVPTFPSIQVRDARQGFFEPEEIARVVGLLPDYLTAMIRFLALTGWRVGEAKTLQWKNIDFKAETIRLEPNTTKNDEGRIYPFATNQAMKTLLAEQRRVTSEIELATGQIVPWVFHCAGKQIRDYRTAWRTATRKAGLPGRRVHDIRRTVVRDLDRNGVRRHAAMKLIGHKTEEMYRRYSIVSEGDLTEAVSLLSGTELTQQLMHKGGGAA